MGESERVKLNRLTQFIRDNQISYPVENGLSGDFESNLRHIFGHLVRENKVDDIVKILKFDDPEIMNSFIFRMTLNRDLDMFNRILDHPDLDIFMNEGLMLSTLYVMRHYSLSLFDVVMNRKQIKDKIITIDGPEQLSVILDKFISDGKDSYLYPVGYVYDPLAMIRSGFFPASGSVSSEGSHILSEYINGIDLDTIDFWTNSLDPKRNLEDLSREPRWSYYTLETIKKKGIDEADSIGLSLFLPELMYKNSKRPMTDMIRFRTQFNNRIRKSDIIDGNQILLQGIRWNILPVTRYAAGMSRGLFNEESDKKFCGTFYYYEPESTTYLAFQTRLHSFNKYTAALQLGIKSDPSIGPKVKQYSDGTIRSDLMLTPNEAYNIKKPIASSWTQERVSALPQTRRYAGIYLGLYASEDTFDQPLCQAGKKEGIQVITFSNMAGSHQVVSEILDTRDRMSSFESLLYVID